LEKPHGKAPLYYALEKMCTARFQAYGKEGVSHSDAWRKQGLGLSRIEKGKHKPALEGKNN
jgi:hypothetical protein